jgi:D-alanine transfer protein
MGQASTAGGPTSSGVRTPHLVAAAIVTGVLACVAVAVTVVAKRHEQNQVYALVWQTTARKSQGRALQLAALDRRDLLLMYGSSELDAHHLFANNVNTILRDHPVGFFIFTVGGGAMRSLAIAQRVASLGSAVRDRPVAISISPQWFTDYRLLPEGYFKGQFSRTHALEFTFSSRLSWRLKRELARRLLEYPRIVQTDQLLALGLKCVATDQPSGRLLYYAIWPLGKFDSLVLRTLDHWESLFPSNPIGQLQGPPRVSPALSTEEPVDWDRILEEASAESVPVVVKQKVLSRMVTREVFLDRVENSREWRDLDLLLRVLAHFQARPLLIGMPINGTMYDARGISRSDREIYYQKLRAAVARPGVSFADFSEFDDDPRFLSDSGGHPSMRGWAYYVRTLDEFRRDPRP